MSKPKTKGLMIGFRLPKTSDTIFRALAKAKGKSPGELAEEAILEWMGQ